jgi:antirestriction protein ArdC
MISIYMNRFLKHWRLTGRGEAFCAHVITYADESLPCSPTKWARMRSGKIEGPVRKGEKGSRIVFVSFLEKTSEPTTAA